MPNLAHCGCVKVKYRQSLPCDMKAFSTNKTNNTFVHSDLYTFSALLPQQSDKLTTTLTRRICESTNK